MLLTYRRSGSRHVPKKMTVPFEKVMHVFTCIKTMFDTYVMVGDQ